MKHLITTMGRLLLAGMLLAPAACVRPAALTPPTSAPSAATASASELVVELTDERQVIPETLPAGIRRVTANNTGQAWHAVISVSYTHLTLPTKRIV